MSDIKVKLRDPRRTEFNRDDIALNVRDGILFFKGDTKLFRIHATEVSSTTTSSFQFLDANEISQIQAQLEANNFATAAALERDFNKSLDIINESLTQTNNYENTAHTEVLFNNNGQVDGHHTFTFLPGS